MFALFCLLHRISDSQNHLKEKELTEHLVCISYLHCKIVPQILAQQFEVCTIGLIRMKSIEFFLMHGLCIEFFPVIHITLQVGNVLINDRWISVASVTWVWLCKVDHMRTGVVIWHLADSKRL